ncbi:hypothetical protein LOZ57_003572 [Ophidiomyces ophidiicola]|uniref:uncharacterized protein n=1 Tax=Ophidiomyces ophidiicola TaxID=1387563 RepID=UPI0020C1F98F|nr:uncharacterized protein LOZ57_003572 [Ophidiomyces ophidiicola]KAI1946802.1 hypothetical protein LOZ57_003572 [Ophidiomyces ophidiicola]KAI2055871.1 hypothetical protein LOZ43_003597 [Ophidiomyces ophidiicola]
MANLVSGTALHPTRASHARSHEANFKRVVAKVNDAVRRAHASSKAYTRVHVVSFRWSNDDIGLGTIESDLLQAFRNSFNFKTESYLLQHQSPRLRLDVSNYLNKLINKIDSTSLLIVVYEGHSTTAGQHQNQLLLHGARFPIAPTILWDLIHQPLTACQGDVLVVLDCCAAAVAALQESEVEFLVASAFESSTTANIATSFSSRLIELLESYAKTEVTVAQVHAQLVADAADPGKYLYNTPVHISPASKPSITLRPLNKPNRELTQLKKGDTCGDGKVLISVNLQGKYALPDFEEWKRWLAQDIPDGIADIKIQAVFGAASTFCLFTVPVEVWDMMKDDDAYAFVQFVNTDNFYLPDCPACDSSLQVLSPRQQSAGPGPALQENIPFQGKKKLDKGKGRQ